MYDIGKIKKGSYVTVGEVIEELQKLNKDALFTCCGNYDVYIHVSKDNKVVTIDNEDLSDDYNDEDFYEEIVKPEHKFGGKLDNMIYTVQFCPNNKIYYVRREEYDSNVEKVHLYWSKDTDDSYCCGVYSRDMMRVL